MLWKLARPLFLDPVVCVASSINRSIYVLDSLLSFCVYTVYNERTRTEVRDETTDGGTGEVTTVLGSDEDIEGSL